MVEEVTLLHIHRIGRQKLGEQRKRNREYTGPARPPSQNGSFSTAARQADAETTMSVNSSSRLRFFVLLSAAY